MPTYSSVPDEPVDRIALPHEEASAGAKFSSSAPTGETGGQPGQLPASPRLPSDAELLSLTDEVDYEGGRYTCGCTETREPYNPSKPERHWQRPRADCPACGGRGVIHDAHRYLRKKKPRTSTTLTGPIATKKRRLESVDTPKTDWLPDLVEARRAALEASKRVDPTQRIRSREIGDQAKKNLRAQRAANARYLHLFGHSDRAIGRHLGLDHKTVKTMIEKGDEVDTGLPTLVARVSDVEQRLQAVEREVGLPSGGDRVVEEAVEEFVKWAQENNLEDGLA